MERSDVAEEYQLSVLLPTFEVSGKKPGQS